MSLKTSAGLQDSGTEAESDAKNIEADLGLAELIEQHENTGWSGVGLRWIFAHAEVDTGLDPDDARDLAAFRHDAHKFTGESHGEAREEFAGVPVNQSVPEGADGDAAALSRPHQKQKQTVPTHDDYSRLKGAETYLIELVTPFVLASEYPEVNDRTIAWWWAENRDNLRLREEKILEQREMFRLETVDHGQVVKYLGDRPWRPRRTASSGSAHTPDTARTAAEAPQRTGSRIGEEGVITLMSESMNDDESPDRYSRCSLNKEIVLPTTNKIPSKATPLEDRRLFSQSAKSSFVNDSAHVTRRIAECQTVIWKQVCESLAK